MVNWYDTRQNPALYNLTHVICGKNESVFCTMTVNKASQAEFNYVPSFNIHIFLMRGRPDTHLPL